MTDAEIRELRIEVEAGRQDWDPLKRVWYPTVYGYWDAEAGEFRDAYYQAPWPGAPRLLSARASFWGGYSREIGWVVEFGEQLGLDLPPALVPVNLARPFSHSFEQAIRRWGRRILPAAEARSERRLDRERRHDRPLAAPGVPGGHEDRGAEHLLGLP